MTKARLIYADAVFVFMSLAIFATGWYKTNVALAVFIIVLVLTSCLVRHINYYKLNKKIY